MKSKPIESVMPAWQSVVLVCKECRKRSNGPKGLKSKPMASEIKRAARDIEPRPRIVLTNCLGLCPKGAATIAVVGSNVATRALAVTSLKQAGQGALSLLAPMGQ
jgi:predicted metal-binding protein